MLFVLDNYDSFTYNLVQYLGELGGEPVVYRNDALTVAEVLALAPTAVVLSPGPCTPSDAGILVPLVKALTGKVPILGVCLGHQAIGEAFGGRVVRAERLMHGKTCPVVHEADELFAGIPSPVTGMRYHSLVVEPKSLPRELAVTAWSGDRPQGAEIMAMKHRTLPIHGVQFHPESIGTEHGKQLIENFLRIAGITPALTASYETPPRPPG
jgi:anthranilate synthase/aminodeoxychorismate synthase-like glutamine amidotransferase